MSFSVERLPYHHRERSGGLAREGHLPLSFKPLTHHFFIENSPSGQDV
jgi:hypothetical protein